MKRSRVSCAVLMLIVYLAPLRAEEKPQSPAQPPPSFRAKLLNDPDVDRSRKDYRPCAEAATQLRLAMEAYREGRFPVDNLLAAERKLTSAQIHYMTVSNNSRGVPAMRELLARQGEVAAIERGLASTTALTGTATDADLPKVREEMKQYEEALKEARRELLRAEYAWKTASRADQLRYLNRNNDPR